MNFLPVQVDDRRQLAQECGDFQNWAKTVEWDMKNIASALDYVQREDAAGFAAAQPAAT